MRASITSIVQGNNVQGKDMWGGTITFGEYWAGYVGKPDQNSPHAHIAIQLAIGIDGDVVIDWRKRCEIARAVIIGSRVQHVARASGDRVAFLYVYPNAQLGRAMQRWLNHRDVVALDVDIANNFSAPIDFRQIISVLKQSFSENFSLDHRLEHAITKIMNDGCELGVIARAASSAGVSEPRLRYLANSQIGVPLSQLAIWRKLELAMQAISQGATLSDAAACGGFSDQAHLSRIMRRMFGVTPRKILPSLISTSDSFKNSSGGFS